jgi:hypothetical protein
VGGGEVLGGVRGEQPDHVHAGRPARLDARRRVLEHDAVAGFGAELARGQQVALGVGLAAAETLGRHEHRRHRQPGGAQAGGGQRHRARGDHGEAAGVHRGQEVGRPGQRDDAVGVARLAQVDGPRLGGGV